MPKLFKKFISEEIAIYPGIGKQLNRKMY